MTSVITMMRAMILSHKDDSNLSNGISCCRGNCYEFIMAITSAPALRHMFSEPSFVSRGCLRSGTPDLGCSEVPWALLGLRRHWEMLEPLGSSGNLVCWALGALGILTLLLQSADHSKL